MGKTLDNMVRNESKLCNHFAAFFIFTGSFAVYLDLGRVSSDSATLGFTFAGSSSRYWDIKVSQIPCDVNYE